MVGIEHEAIAVGHLSIEVHALLESAHVFHSSHPFVLGDDYGLCRFAEVLHVYHKLAFVEMRHLRLKHV